MLNDQQLKEAAAELCRLRGLNPEHFSEFDSCLREIVRLQEVYQALQWVTKNKF